MTKPFTPSGRATVLARGTAIVLAMALMGCGGGGTGGAVAVTPAPTPSPSASSPTPSPSPSPSASPSPTPSSTGTATAFAAQMIPGWNLGNSLESLDGGAAPAGTSRETAYGNPVVTQAQLDAVAAAGFRSVRIPVSWLQYADANDMIAAAWFVRVQQVVDYARNAGLTVIINIHYDGGWLQPSYAQQTAANARLTRFWTQIATRFRGYDDRLLFAGTNEVMLRDVYSAPTAENCTVQKGFNQAFVDAVRATGGNNATRYLVVQGYNTNIDYTIGCNAALPTDSASGRLMMEVHYYDPYDFALNEGSRIWQWGAAATDPSVTAGYGNEAYVDGQFQKMKTTFVDNGVPVILGEYGAISKNQYDPSGTYRTAWDRYVTRSAYLHGMVPIIWDNGFTGDHGLGLFNRGTGAVAYPGIVDAVVGAAR